MTPASGDLGWSATMDGPIAYIRLDDGKANAYTTAGLAELNRLLDDFEDDARAVILSGREGYFSAGFDLSVVEAKGEPLDALLEAGARTFARLLVYPRPVVAACTGHALAAAALVLLSSDIRVGVEGPYKIGLNEVAIGSPLPTFLIELASYRMPPAALDSILWGDTVEPVRAISIGYLDEVVAAEELEPRCVAVASRLAALPRRTLSAAKRALRAEVAERMVADIDGDLALLNPTYERRTRRSVRMADPSSATSPAGGPARRRRAHGRFADRLYEGLGSLDDDLPRWSDSFIFGDVWGRPGLSHDDRMLVVIVTLAATGNLEQLRYYIEGALSAGLATERIHESLMMLTVYVGFPAALAAVAVLKKVVADRTRREATA